MAARTKKRRPAPGDRLLNRELSFLDYDARVLDLARRPGAAAARAGQVLLAIFSQMLDEFFMVRIAGLIGQAAAGVTVRSPDGRTPQQALAEARGARARAERRASRSIWRRSSAPRSRRRGSSSRSVDDLDAAESRGAARALGGRDLPGADAARRRPRAAVPVHLRAVGQPRGVRLATRRRRGAVRARQGARGAAALPRRSAEPGSSCRWSRCSSTTCRRSSPAWRSSSSSLFRVTRDADLEVSDEADDLLEAVELELRRARFGEVTRLEVSESMSAAMRRAAADGLRAADDFVYPVDGMLDLADVGELAELDRPDLKDEPWAPVARPPLGATDARRAVRRDPLPATSSSITRTTRSPRASRRSSTERVRPERDRDQVDRVPDERRHAARAGADRGGRARQAERLPRRDQGARRRAAEHRVVARARAGGRARRLRVPGAEDPREDDARRAPRAGGRCAATSTSAPATTTTSPRAPTRTSGSSPRTRRSPPTSPTSSTTSPDSAARRTSASSSWRRSRSRRGSSRRSASVAEAARGGREGADPHQGQRARPTSR